jgi:hypothetical protein
VQVEIDITQSAFANARAYYDQRRQSAVKQQRTIDTAGAALKAVRAFIDHVRPCTD